MKENFSLENVFIRSMANRGQLGGLARATEDVIKILDVYGCDVIIVETVGVGQTEVSITEIADTVVLVLVPESGDEIQAMKAGLTEIADIIVVNKADRGGAERLSTELLNTLALSPRKHNPPIIIAQAVNDVGIDKLYEELEKRRLLKSSPATD